ncbi:hypothetical protein BGX31_000395 [Mortierella sp. GBA43]|nr:hypothetical protein BGX31_000395 [Mortierella sp. GBA43]
MLFRKTVPSPKAALTPHQVLQLANIYLENAHKSDDHDIALVLCQHAEAALSEAKGGPKSASAPSSDPNGQAVREKIATAYYHLGELLENQGHRDIAQTFYKKSEKWGGHNLESGQLSKYARPLSTTGSIKTLTVITNASHTKPSRQAVHGTNIATVPSNIFPRNLQPPTLEFKAPDLDSRLSDTPQLSCCLALLQSSHGPEEIVNLAARNWLQLVKDEPEEHDRLNALATDVIRAFKRDEFKDTKAVTEVVYLAAVLEKDDFRYLLKEFYMGIEQSTLLDVHQLEGLAQLIQGADTSFLDADDLVKVLELLSTRLQGTHQQSPQHLYQLTFAVSNVLDAMADAEVKGLDRENIHQPLLSYLEGLKGSSDPYLVYQAAYTYQALLCVPDNESLWKATLRRTGKVVKGISGLVSAVKGLDLNGFIEGLESIQQGMDGVSNVIHVVKNAYDGATSLAKGGQGFLKGLKAGLSFNRKCAWYPALRGADTMIQEGQLAEFKKLICEAPCRRDMAFQWGVCQRLGEIAVNTTWDEEVRREAMKFLAEIYKDDNGWGQHTSVKQLILNIFMHVLSNSTSDTPFAEALLLGLQNNGDSSKQALYQSCREGGPSPHPLKIGLPAMGSPSLLDRVQERPDVEGSLRQLRRLRLKERGNAVYIPPQAKANQQTRDETGFPLMDKVSEFIASNDKVFLLLGDSGAGKSTFNKELEYQLWQAYRKKAGAIPLYINLPAIDKPEHDMIAKQLRKVEFTEPQIRELKLHRSFILICDGYDESQQTHNLYTSNRLNRSGEWSAKMVISCRSEYLGIDYRDRFQPGDRNQRSESSLFQEAVVMPFSMGQVQEYIRQYVSVRRPLWEVDEYKKALDSIPSLKDLVRNPFLMSLSLEVLPRIVDPGQGLSEIHVTRVALYDHFIENWLERGKKRLGEKNLSPQARAAFENLSDEGFTRNGIAYLKKLSAAIYKEQSGQPIVSYSRYKEESSWKTEFFSREEEKQLLREACPLVRSGNQHRFIHRSLLELEDKTIPGSAPVQRRGSTSSALSFLEPGPTEKVVTTVQQDPILDSPLAWRNFVNDPSVLQFLEERVQQEPLFKQQLLNYLEQSKGDKKWRTAAANAITILVRVGVQFNHADLRGIQIPGADLSYGLFESAQLQGADLRHVDFRAVCLKHADLSEAQMAGVRFGELPYLEHDDIVSKCAFSPNGETLSVSVFACHIIVYSTSTWEVLHTMEGHERWISSILYSPVDNRLVSGSDDSTVRLWDIKTGTCCHVMQGHEAAVNSVVYSPAGDQLATASDDMTVKLWDIESGKCHHTLRGHTNRVKRVLYSPKRNQIASGSQDSTVRLWDVETKECTHVLISNFGRTITIAYSPHGDQLASSGGDRAVLLWNPITGECYRTIPNQSYLFPLMAYSPKGHQLATVSKDNAVQLWDIETGLCLHEFIGSGRYVIGLRYSSDGQMIMSVGYDEIIRVWDTETGDSRETLFGHSGPIRDAVFSPKCDRIVSTSDDGTVRLWDVGTGTSRQAPDGHREAVRGIKCSPNGRQVATASLDKTIRLWGIETGACIRTIDHSGTATDVAFSPQGHWIVSASDDSTLKLWNLKTGECLLTLTGHNEGVNSVDVSPNGSQIASGSDDCTIRLWNADTKDCCQVLKGHSKRVLRIAYSTTGEMIASASEDATVRLWDVASGDCRNILIGHYGTVYTVVYSPDGRQLASGSVDKSIRIWDLHTETSLLTLLGHDGGIMGLVYSTRGDLVVSASDDQTVRLWDVASGQCRFVLDSFQREVCVVDWVETLDANYLVAGGSNGEMIMWKVIIDGDQCRALVHRRTTGELDLEGATIQGAQGLTTLNKRLLKQRKAVGEPEDRMFGAMEKVVKMVSVVSTLQSAFGRTIEDAASNPGVTVDQNELQQTRESRRPEIRDAVAALVKALKGTNEEDVATWFGNESKGSLNE